MGTLVGLLEVFAVAAGTGGVILRSWYHDPRQRIHRRLARLPVTPIASARENEPVRISGVVKALSSWVASPIHNRSCVFYRATIQRNGRRAPVADEQHGVPFVIEDESGYAIVEPQAADLVTSDHSFLPALMPDPVLDAFLARHGIHFKQTVRVCERRIEVGQKITVMGTPQREADPLAKVQEGYRSEIVTCARFASSKRYPLVVSDAL